MSTPAIGPVLVVGTGLVGASVGLALRRVGVEVLLDDADAANLAHAIERGAGRALDGTAPQIVVVAVPPDVAGAVMAAQAERWPHATITDVTSVKDLPLREATTAGGATRVVGGHPMAGREVSGPAGARADLFDDRVWVVTPLPGSDPERVATVGDLARACGAVTVTMSPVEHDAAVALTSHTPQVLASVLAGLLVDVDAQSVGVSGQGLRDMTRIADSDPVLWGAILRANAGPVARVLKAMVERLDAVAVGLLDDGSVTEVDEALRRGAIGRARIPGKHGTDASTYAVVPVMVRDEPGELARLFVAAGELGINLEDVRIEHVLGRPSGLIDLSVRPEVGEALARGLRAQGFDVRA